MRTRWVLGSVLAVVSACASHESEIEELEWLDEDGFSIELLPMIPDGERVRQRPREPEADLPPDPPDPPDPPVATEPRVLVVAKAPDDDSDCGIWVDSAGFPAVSADGSSVIVLEDRFDESADTSSVDVTWIDQHDDSDRELMRVRTHGHEPPLPCRRYRREIAAAVAEINARLVEDGARSLPRLPVRIDTRDDYPEKRGSSVDVIEALYLGRSLILRHPGVAVLERRERPDWLGSETWPCDFTPHLRQIHGAAELGVAVVVLDHDSGGCLCHTAPFVGVVPLAPETFARIEALASRVGPGVLAALDER